VKVVVVYQPTGNKYRTALKIDIPVVLKDWICEMQRVDHLINPESFQIPPLKDTFFSIMTKNSKSEEK